jgi:putative tryptophan/tyrosine transport system substrate-binding protein
MRRRKFIKLIGGAAVAWPLAARAQQPRMPVIGFLHSASRDPYASQLDAFRQSLKETGYVEGQNVAIEYRWAENDTARLPKLAEELAQHPVSVIVAGGSPASALAAKSVTAKIPIVFMNAADPVAINLVSSFNRPGGNVTGSTLLSAELVAKRLGILRDLLPSLKKIAMLVNPTRPGVDAQKAQMQDAAQGIGLASPDPKCEQRTRLRCCFPNSGWPAGRRTRCRSRRALSRPARSNRRFGNTP